tara:strand:+ start:311 stop:1021 length:711 start_codon:yes stop_codon:yes gene_type:complete
MSKIKLNAASGGGSVSLEAPTSTTSNANVEFKLPIADGTNGQFIKTDGSGQFSFGTVTDNNTWVKLSSTTISSNVSDVTFTNSITGAFDTYNMYAIIFTQLQATNDGVELRMRIQEGGSTITSTNYRARVHSMDGDIDNAVGSRDHLRLLKASLGNATSGSVVNEDTNGIIYMTNFMVNREWRYYGFHMHGSHTGDLHFDNFGGGYKGSNATTGVLVYPESGSWASGTLALYGIAQ